MDEQGLKKLLKLAFEAGYDYYADTYFDNEFRKSFDEWYDEQKLLQHVVMQVPQFEELLQVRLDELPYTKLDERTQT